MGKEYLINGALSGRVNVPSKLLMYEGTETDTAKVEINNKERTIAVNVKVEEVTKDCATKEELNNKQDTLISGETIKTINNQSILGSGDISAVGPEGPQGPKGDKGDTGEQGPAGRDGLTTSISVNGETYTQVEGTITLPNYPDISGKQDILTEGNGISLENDTVSVDTSVIATQEQITSLSGDIDAIEEKIPAQASAQNQLADKEFVNSSIATNTAHFLGTYNIITDLELTVDATEVQIASAIATKLASESITVTNNDYVFVAYPNATVSTQYDKFDRYKYSDESTSWEYEYTLNNSSFTAEQWAAINSGITANIVSDIVTLSGDQTITGAKTFSNGINIPNSHDILCNGTTSIRFTPYSFRTYAFGPLSNGSYDIGYQNSRYKDGYFSGQVYAQNTLNVINSSDIVNNRTLTQEQLSLLLDEKPTLIKGYIAGAPFASNAFIFQLKDNGYNYTGLAFYNDNGRVYQYADDKGLSQITVDKATLQISAAKIVSLSNSAGLIFEKFNSKTIPAYPSNTGTFTLQQVDGALQWNQVNAVPTLPTTDGKYKLVCNVVSGVPTMTWELEPDGMSYTEDAPQSYSGNITTYQGDGVSAIETYIKFDTPPTSSNDWDAFVDIFGTPNGLTSYSNKTKIYVWGESSLSAVTINNVETTGGVGYSNAVEIALTGDYDIALKYQNGDGALIKGD